MSNQSNASHADRLRCLSTPEQPYRMIKTFKILARDRTIVMVPCPDCSPANDYPCETCGGSGSYAIRSPIGWNFKVDRVRLESYLEQGNYQTGYQVWANLEEEDYSFFADIGTLNRDSFVELNRRAPELTLQLSLRLLGYRR